jgi:hypothetical protein
MKKLALCVGINDYPGADSDLYGCVNDARDWCALLESLGFGVECLVDQDATRDGVLLAMDRLFSRRGYHVMTYSGHGSYVPDENGDEPDGVDECLCPQDIVENGPIVDDEINSMLLAYAGRGPCIMVSDSCHSGTVSRAAFGARFDHGDSPAGRPRFLAPGVFGGGRMVSRLTKALGRPDRKASTKVLDGGLLLMAGCQDYEYSYDANIAGKPNGAFTYWALKTLRKLGDGATFNDWFRAIRRKLPCAQYPQTPNLVGPRSARRDRIFIA